MKYITILILKYLFWLFISSSMDASAKFNGPDI